MILKQPVYPYIPNSVPRIREEMLKEIGIESVEELFCEIPQDLRFSGKLQLPEPFLSEYSLKRHVESILVQNKSCNEYLNFLGGGTWQHYVPAVCDEINSRGEFLTAYSADVYADHGKWQALFEYQSLLGELLEMDVVSIPTYDWGQAAGNSIRMAARITKRKEVLLPSTISPERLMQIQNYCKNELELILVDYDKDSGLLDLKDLVSKINLNTAAVYIENPSYLGVIESQGENISYLAREYGALFIVAVDPISLGILAAPSSYGADIVCGDLQPLGMHMQFGAGLSGFIATPDEEKFLVEYPALLYGITSTSVSGEYGFGICNFDFTSYGSREKGNEYTGTTTGLWAITAAVYLSLMGPKGMSEIGEGIMQRCRYAMNVLNRIEGVQTDIFKSGHFKEFVVRFSDSGKTVTEINKSLLDHGIFGGVDLSRTFPEFGNSALYCVTEIHTKEDIDRLAASIEWVLNH